MVEKQHILHSVLAESPLRDSAATELIPGKSQSPYPRLFEEGGAIFIDFYSIFHYFMLN